MTSTFKIFLAFHNPFMRLVHMEVHSKGYFLMRIQSKFEAGWGYLNTDEFDKIYFTQITMPLKSILLCNAQVKS